MRAGRVAIFCTLMFSTAAHAGYFEVRWTETWRVTGGRPYAVWKAQSETAAGSVLTVIDGDLIDKAYLRPQELFRTEQDVFENGILLLPKDSLLVKMRGGDGNNYCTWAYGDRINSAEWVEKVAISGDIGRYLCFKADQNDITRKVEVFQGLFPALITIFRVGSGLFGKKIGDTSPTKIVRINSENYFKSSQLRVKFKFSKKGNVESPCLIGGLSRSSAKKLELSSAQVCFAEVGDRITAWGGAYTLIKQQGNQVSIKVDQPINLPEIAPAIEG